MIERNDLCWCGSGKKWKKCCYPEMQRTSDDFSQVAPMYLKKWGIILKTKEQIDGIRKASHLTAHILDEVCDAAKEGVTTNFLNDLAEKKILEAGGIPASLHYGNPPFPKSICTSLNEVICHGIPNDEPLRKGDIANIDLAVILHGYYGDCSKMVAIGPVSEEKMLVFDVSLKCLQEAIKMLHPGALISEVGEVISSVAEKYGLSVVDQFVGHGVGIRYHEAPQVFHSRNSLNVPLHEGMIFTIEPMINFGVKHAVVDKQDRWTARTKDGKPSAQWEHTLLITKDGCEILTPWKETHCKLG